MGRIDRNGMEWHSENAPPSFTAWGIDLIAKLPICRHHHRSFVPSLFAGPPLLLDAARRQGSLRQLGGREAPHQATPAPTPAARQ